MGNDQRAIVGFMGAAVLFALVGDVIKSQKSSVPSGAYVKIILGGGIGAGLLVLLSDTGSGASEFAKGLALITMVASVLVNGTDVFSGVSKVTGNLKTTNTIKPPTIVGVPTAKAG
jgi:high-affinity Fe2+/Pb2+ permease